MTASGSGEVTAVTVAERIRRRPLRFLVSSWPLRTLAYVVSGVVSGLATLVWLPVAMLLGAFALTPLLIAPLVTVERQRVRLLGGPALPDPHRTPDRSGLSARLRARYAEAITWRELAYTVLNGTVLLLVDLAALVVGLAPALLFLSGAVSFVESGPGTATAGSPDHVSGTAFIGVGAALAVVAAAILLACTTAAAAVARAELARLLLSAEDETRIRTLTMSRARLIDAFEVERRRIERDLHDGAQQRLLRLGMTLVTAQLELDKDPEAARSLIATAADEAKATLTELRELVRGIHPRVLTDLGLPPAVAELAVRSPLPVTVALEVPQRLPAPVESAAYFVVAEALTNAAKHAHAERVEVTGAVTGGTLYVEIHDDGVGGADPTRGSGLSGLADRVDALDGTLVLASPPGGPTVVRLEVPCSA
ncbi:sensor histidine kinase [Actinomadura rudentiformis]|uniref:histidine kinase n=1 Tax=Actinomadura rudentiformis TaxID=359158 RepID=A0A6H9Z8I0_9ACTN|nr:histidine kinase [Actinomadura rudentiformis]KAB2350236.1 sensor histidine kinase [Actinomadura rudentiformis]